MDLLGIGHLIQPSDINLGGCGPVGQHGSEVLLFETELHGCGSVLAMMDDALVYTFALNYQPNPIGATPIIRTSSAVVGLQCHYMRLHNVSSNALKPTWIPYHSTLSAEELLVFSMRLMADHWQLERGSNVFFLGDLINIEVSVVQANHMPLRVFVDTCVATLDPDMNAVPRYAFIENDGCLMDSKLTNSRSQFLSRVQDDKLQFQLDAFRFAQEARSAYMSLFCFPGAQYAGTAVLGPIVVQEAAKESQSRVKADDRAEGFVGVRRQFQASLQGQVSSRCLGLGLHLLLFPGRLWLGMRGGGAASGPEDGLAAEAESVLLQSLELLPRLEGGGVSGGLEGAADGVALPTSTDLKSPAAWGDSMDFEGGPVAEWAKLPARKRAASAVSVNPKGPKTAAVEIPLANRFEVLAGNLGQEFPDFEMDLDPLPDLLGWDDSPE
ncbi:hypothetical protein SKAU_G00385020 [Synaphobranchus kaupii]|uniref:Zona pellucida sperm-binding protein 3 n=1 Tax=Synaphobranchus kaupii TaxID=118154 RepID=A0A9Q1EED7_SYNKA|nr:hypothetical protein SKAU_G00385020 [Synaphobranchus kaupii]